jgi:hypothetical protein
MKAKLYLLADRRERTEDRKNKERKAHAKIKRLSRRNFQRKNTLRKRKYFFVRYANGIVGIPGQGSQEIIF